MIHTMLSHQELNDIAVHLDAALHQIESTVATEWHITQIDKIEDKLQILWERVYDIYKSRGHSPRYRD